MALTANTNLEVAESTGNTETASFVVASGSTIFAGAYVAIASGTGHIVNVADTAGLLPIGFAMDAATGNSPATNEVPANVGGSVGIDVTVATAGATNVGEGVFATDENTFTLVATANIPKIGSIIRHKTGNIVDVRFFSAAQIQGDTTL